VSKRFRPRAGILLGTLVLATQASPSRAAVVEWYAGPVALGPGQMVQVAIGNPDIFPCTMGIQILASAAARAITSLTNAPLTAVVNTSKARPPSSVQVVGYTDPRQAAGRRRLVAAAVRADCPGTSETLVREFGVTMQILDPATGLTSLVIQAPAE
jgi:hypothetical protein